MIYWHIIGYLEIGSISPGSVFLFYDLKATGALINLSRTGKGTGNIGGSAWKITDMKQNGTSDPKVL